jgi:predicted nucleic acid-binding Zn finger protein
VSRLTAADVKLAINNADAQGGRQVMALVQGRNRVYVVDHDTHWGDKWYCTCPPDYRPKDGADCAHIRATKEAIGE